MKIVGFFWEIGPWFPSPHRRSVNFKDFGSSHTVGFFDGACSEGLCGCGATILTQAGLQYHFHWSAGARSSSRAKLVAVWGIIRCAPGWRLMRWRLQGTQTVIDWVQGFSSFGPPALFNWMSQISSFKRIKFTHVYHEQNQSVDSLSKRGRTTMPRQIFFSILLDGSINNSGAFSF